MRSILSMAALSVAILAGTALAQEQVYKIGNGVKAPVLIKEVKPSYTKGAMDRRVAGTVELSAVVLANGTVDDVKVTKSLDDELDQQAIEAAQQWKFRPGTKDGEPVAVQIALELTFTLRK